MEGFDSPGSTPGPNGDGLAGIPNIATIAATRLTPYSPPMRALNSHLPEAHRILTLAWPVMLTSLNWTLLQATDVAVVGWTGTDQAAALSASRSITYVGFMIAFGLMTSILVFVSRADGAGEMRRTGQLLHDGLLLGLILGVVSGTTMWVFALPLLLGIGVEPHLAPAAAQVVRIMALAFVPSLLNLAASFFLEGVSRPRRVMVVQLATIPFNAVLAWAWSGGHLGLPALGAVGATAATAVASLVGAAGLILAAWTLPDAAARGVRDFGGRTIGSLFVGAAKLARFGLMPGVSSGLELSGISILIALSTQLGEVTANAFQIVFAIHNLVFGIGMGFASAAGVRAGNAVGEGTPRAATPRAMVAVGLAFLFMGLFGVALIAFADPASAIFAATPQVHALATDMLRLWAPFILLDGVQIVLLFTLRSLGDQVAAGFASITSFFLVTGGSGLLMVQWGWGPFALVGALAAGMACSVALLGARLAIVHRRLSL